MSTSQLLGQSVPGPGGLPTRQTGHQSCQACQVCLATSATSEIIGALPEASCLLAAAASDLCGACNQWFQNTAGL